MSPGILVGGAPQSFCFPKDHEAARCFKGMKAIPEERGFGDQIRDVGRECPKFRFPPRLPPSRSHCDGLYVAAVSAEWITHNRVVTSPLKEHREARFLGVPPQVPAGA